MYEISGSSLRFLLLVLILPTDGAALVKVILMRTNNSIHFWRGVGRAFQQTNRMKVKN